MNALVTAGATRNPIDAMRYLSARSTGSTGIFIANALRERGVSPWLLGSAEARLRDPGLPGEEYGSTRDLMAKVETWVRANPTGILVHSAAVGDYERADASAGKTPSGMPEWTLTLTPTPKIADHVRGWGFTGIYVTFKAAAPGTTPEELEGIARRQRDRTGCDLVFANVLGRTSKDVALVGGEIRWFAERRDGVDALIAALRPPLK